MFSEGFEVDRRKIQLPQPLKELGVTKVGIKLFRDITAEISVTLLKKGGESSVAEGVAATEGFAEPSESVEATAESSEEVQS